MSSLEGHPGARCLAQTEKTFFFLLFLPGGAACSGRQRSRTRGFLARREPTLDGEDRCETIAVGGKESSPYRALPQLGKILDRAEQPLLVILPDAPEASEYSAQCLATLISA
jgi:hypothetical protein